ncbi:MAG TPA: dienelactone hydrolase family protein [Burkholderiaceae bacterium]|nr:dienelactone hydrolase family protein [Burkholderiaceae bacterium]
MPAQSQWIPIKAEDGQYGAYLSLPPAGKGPGLVLFQEIFGVNRHIRAVADQYALDGFVVLAPDVFWRQAPRVELGYAGADMDRARALMTGITPAQLLADIGTTVKALRARGEVSGKVGAFGYCMGGRLAYFAAATAGVDAASCFYGGGIHDNLDKAAGITCPIQFHYGERDKVIPPAAVEKVKAAMAGKRAEVFLYEADHGFNCWERGSYEPRSAALAHARTLAHFTTHLF